MQIDKKGAFGEHFIAKIFKDNNFLVEYHDNKTGVYDLKINNKKIEIKTATPRY
ncbi:hypothetical protein JTY60_00610 [symbiont of Argiope bruennichi]|uniref:hypothetical protein n=1 Tax=symbiont of Argiope bruennichi TaxID=2810479 RepID=UPI003DA5DD0F